MVEVKEVNGIKRHLEIRPKDGTEMVHQEQRSIKDTCYVSDFSISWIELENPGREVVILQKD